MDRKGAQAICNRVVALLNSPNTRTLKFTQPSKSLTRELASIGWNDPDGEYAKVTNLGVKEIFERRSTGGSCGSWDIVRVHPLRENETVEDATSADLADDYQDNDLRWATWGESSSLISIDHRAVVLAGHSAVYVYQNDKRVPVCVIKAPSVNTRILKGGGAVCVAAQKHNLVATAGTSFDPDRSELKEWGIQNDEAKLLPVSMGGQPARLAHYHYDSGAGCGGSLEYLAEVGADNHILDTRLSRNLLGIRPDDTQHKWSADYPTQNVTMFQGRALVVRTERATTEVYGINGSELKHACTLEDVPVYVVSRILVQ